ncbi:MAG: hypothetical protein KF881_08800 [Acidobacteria bacterium]|nr:hypothetical protein [Acidobacteriota bacterium]
MRRTIFLIGIFFLGSVLTAPAQETGELALKRYFEGRKVVVKIDMPGTRSGVDLHPDDPKKTFDFNKHLRRLRDFGTSIPNGAETMITKIEFDGKTIEVHLDGGGFGNSADLNRVGPEPQRPVDLPKTQRELDLEKQITTETDRRKLAYLRDELEYERRRRKEADRRQREEYEDRVRERNERLEYERSIRGSRFNLVYKNRSIPKTLAPQDIMNALERYVDFSATQMP